MQDIPTARFWTEAHEEGNHPQFSPSIRFAGKHVHQFGGRDLRRRSRGRTGTVRIAGKYYMSTTIFVKRFSELKECRLPCAIHVAAYLNHTLALEGA
jgi:hypothetical protein